ncbi:hypothetical protein DXG03_001909 [Asterophora parasitica]|uniref:Uncharacterized protein n=1 Tax=Asterophora parasitica TaxID=117018 RepID=A0A9P7G2L1_9AGAR|nr:hypothetical protein DXG03_001909 [Asterophora parasitica]
MAFNIHTVAEHAHGMDKVRFRRVASFVDVVQQANQPLQTSARRFTQLKECHKGSQRHVGIATPYLVRLGCYASHAIASHKLKEISGSCVQTGGRSGTIESTSSINGSLQSLPQ